MQDANGGSCAGAVAIAAVGFAVGTGILIASGGTGLALIGFLSSRVLGTAGIINGCA